MTVATPKSIPEYLDQLRAALRGADPAVVQDALYDAEEYLRAELGENPQMDEAAVVAQVAGSYGAPAEVAEIYRETEVRVSHALRTPRPDTRGSAWGRFFGVAVDPRTYGALFYMLLALATGIVYFSTVVTGLSLSLGLSVLIIGIPFVILFLGIVRALSLVEGRIVEVMLGERMPRRPLYSNRGRPLLSRIGAMFTDPRTWSTMLYMVLMLPLGIVYFTVTIAGLSVSIGVMLGAVARVFGEVVDLRIEGEVLTPPVWTMPLFFALGAVLLFLVLHVARGLGRLHGGLAKHLLVKSAQH
jgi:hypothetical protein